MRRKASLLMKKRIFEDLETEHIDKYVNSPKDITTGETQNFAGLEYGIG